ncbi:MAG: PDDEXK nuclease domain-containing protein [Prevotellaceae bacterium]|nr:PDDEXK nuclease domain-containing protein [Prevotellaceae bacterium]
MIEQIAKALRDKYPEKKGYSPRNLKYMCQFAKQYPLNIISQLAVTDKDLEMPTAAKILLVVKALNSAEVEQELPDNIQIADTNDNTFGQQAVAQIQSSDSEINTFGQQLVAQIQLPDSERNTFGQQAVAQIQLPDSESNTFAQQAAVQIQSPDSENNTFAQQAVARIQDIPLVLAEITQLPITQVEAIFASSSVAKINWASHVVLMNSKLPLGVRYWYIKQALEFGWSRNILSLQIDSGLFQRQVRKRKVNNFTATLPKPQSDLASYLLKDPYIFDLAGVKEHADERDIEVQLVSHVTKYLLEMGTGFAFVARQKHFQIGDKDFYADLILYNINLHAYVVVELKATSFKPEYAGQLNFYINVVNDKLKGEHDNRTIGLLLCRGKDEIMAQYALEGYNQPIGVSDYQLSKAIPEELKSTLPSIEEVEQELAQLLERN